MDLFRPQHYERLGGNHYCLVLVDDFSRFSWVYFLVYKSETQDYFKKIARRAQNDYGVIIKHVRSDDGIEFKNLTREEFFDQLGVTHEFSVAYMPQQNGVLECKNRTLIEMG